jgi:hypothetical protein
MNVTDRIAVWNGTSVQRSVVFAGTPTVVLLGQDVKCGGPRTRVVPSRNMVSNSALAIANMSGASRRARQVTGGPGVLRMWWIVF